ncbi:unnamed protein product [Prunus brigantina]
MNESLGPPLPVQLFLNKLGHMFYIRDLNSCLFVTIVVSPLELYYLGLQIYHKDI